jgi:hypothetical protein
MHLNKNLEIFVGVHRVNNIINIIIIEHLVFKYFLNKIGYQV